MKRLEMISGGGGSSTLRVEIPDSDRTIEFTEDKFCVYEGDEVVLEASYFVHKDMKEIHYIAKKLFPNIMTNAVDKLKEQVEKSKKKGTIRRIK